MKKGSVLLQVLITSLVVAFIAAGLAKMMLMRATVIERATRGAVGVKGVESAFNNVMTAWVSAKNTCVPVPGYSCSGCCAVATPCGCNCKYTATDGSGRTICAGGQCSPAQPTTPSCGLQASFNPP